jgi:hypothetical protein
MCVSVHVCMHVCMYTTFISRRPHFAVYISLLLLTNYLHVLQFRHMDATTDAQVDDKHTVTPLACGARA